MGPFLEHVQCPEEIKKRLAQINQEMKEHGRIEDEGVIIPKLTEEQTIALVLFRLIGEVNELIDNLNIVLSDLGRLAAYSPLFSMYGTPLKRYKLLLRSFFYEFSRFEDLHGYFLKMMEELGKVSKQDRQAMRASFYDRIKPMLDTRNRMLHGLTAGLEKCVPPEAFLLEFAENFQYIPVRQSDKTIVTWKDILSPVCVKNRTDLFEVANGVREYWNMFFTDLSSVLAQKGKL